MASSVSSELMVFTRFSRTRWYPFTGVFEFRRY